MMEKEFESLEDLSKQEIIVKKGFGVYMDGDVQTMLHKTTVGVEFKGHIETLRQVLTELQQIKEAQSSKALECLDTLEKLIEEITINNADLRNTLKTSVLIASIKQSLLKAQELEKENAEYKNMIEIIWKKPTQSRVTIAYLKTTFNPTYEDYYSTIRDEYQITAEEFELLKRWYQK